MAQAAGDLKVMLTAPLPQKYCLSLAEKFQGIERVTGRDMFLGSRTIERAYMLHTSYK